jgi:prepilin-type N-terminal cleavage/methylation domain-containing protein/prepilin-type processing-associated H-X9-DG protein
MIKSRSGFTLVEILVCLVVVSILTAIISSFVSSSKEKGRRTVCLSNLQQVGTAIKMYASDNDDHYPTENAWIYRRITNASIPACPSVTIPSLSLQRMKTLANDDPLANWGYVTYGYNSQLAQSLLIIKEGGATDLKYKPNSTPMRESQVPFPSNTILAYDAPFEENGGWVKGTVPPDWGIHQSGANYVLCDGHVRWLKTSQISDQQPADEKHISFHPVSFYAFLP